MNILRKIAAVLLVLVLTVFSLWRYDKMTPLTDFAAGLVASAKDLQSTMLGGGPSSGGPSSGGPSSGGPSSGGPSSGGGAGGGAVLPPADTGGNYGDYDPSAPVDEQLFSVIYQGMLNMNEVVDLSTIAPTRAQLSAAVADVIYSSPELFYVASGYNIQTQGDKVMGIKPSYTKAPAEVAQMRLDYEAALNAIVAAAPTGSDFDKLLYLHDYFVLNYTYDYTLTIRDAYTFFTEKTGVCQAYMLALIAAAERLDIEVVPVTSDAMMHAWNMVKLDGEWYHVDLTWDDSGSLPNSISYRYFLQSNNGIVAIDAEREENKRHREWSCAEVADSTRFDAAAWRYSLAPLAKHGSTYYCTVHTTRNDLLGYIYAGSDPAALTELISVEGNGWPASATTRYLDCYSGLLVHGDYLYYNTGNAICRLSLDGSFAKSTYTVTGLSGLQSIYGFVGVEGDAIRYCVATSPRDETPTSALFVFP